MMPAAGTRLFLLEGEGILFSEQRQELHRFNTTASFIWCRFEEGRTEAAIADELAARFALSPRQAAEYVAAAIGGWAGKGLLAGTAGPPLSPPPAGPSVPPGPAHPSVSYAFSAIRTYRLLGTRFAIRGATPTQLGLLHPVFAHLESAGTPDVAFDLTGSVLYQDGLPVAVYRSDDALAPAVYAAAWAAALRRHEFLLNIHAGVLRRGEACVLLPAPPGNGKSTLTAALLRAGFDYFSDEVALLSGKDFHVASFPQAICLKESGIAAAAVFWPQAASLPLHRRPDGKRVAYLPPPRDRLPKPDALGTVRALVFPRYQAGNAMHCARLGKADALACLLNQCTVLNTRLDAATVGRLVAWIAALDCRELVYGETNDAVEAVGRVMDAVRSSQRTRNTQTAK